MRPNDITDYILLASTTVTAGIESSVLNRDLMSGYCIFAAISNWTSTVAGLNFHLEASIDGSRYAPITGTTATVESAQHIIWEYDRPYHNYVKVISTMTAGQITLDIKARAVRI